MERLAKVLRALGFQVTLMLDDPKYPPHLKPTRANILIQMALLVSGTQDGDKLFFAYAGHGIQVPTNDPDEEDGLNECIVPMDSDCGEIGLITDNTLNELLVRPLPHGVTLFAAFDCCNSGTILDLYHLWSWRNGGIYGPHTFPVTELEGSCSPQGNSHGLVICFSAAADGETAWELKQSRVTFLRILTTILDETPGISLACAFKRIRNKINQALSRSRHHQEPEFSSNDSHLDYDNIMLRSFL